MSEQQSNIKQAYERIRAIRSPEDIRGCDEQDIKALCEDIRRVLIDRTEQNGGHLASNLGVVELTVAIHRVFSSPKDHIIFDVGHQAYVHKLLTGRAAAFDTLRQSGGLSGFPRRDESEHDAFGTGHASTSLSAALGMARADHLRGSDAYTVAVLGDGALTGGMIHEALNNCAGNLNLIIVLNENEMSISKNTGRFARLLTGLRTARGYSYTKSMLDKLLVHVPLIGVPMLRGLRSMKEWIKNVLYSSNYFESMGLDYFGPVDGNDENAVEQMLRRAKQKKGCCLVHLRTVKGKGYDKAEQDPGTYHGISPAAACQSELPTFSQTFGQTLTRVADEQSNVCAITAAMRQGTGLVPFFEQHPTKAFDVGIAEQHAVTFAAGLAAGGYLPVVAVYSTFLQRGYDQLLHDVALQRLPVLFAIDRAGLSGSDGPTHHGIYDVSFLSHIPGIDIYEPPTTDALSHLTEHLLKNGLDHPVAIRYPSGRDDARIVSFVDDRLTLTLCEGVYADFDTEQPPETVVVTYGRLTASVISAAARSGQNVGIVLLGKLRPWGDTAVTLAALCRRGVQKIVFCEEGIRSGGIAMNLATELRERLGEAVPTVRILAIDDRDGYIPEPATGYTALEAVGLGEDDILRAILH